jgi:hypothetical protein
MGAEMERRSADRHGVLALAVVEYGFESLRGLILDISSTGARICIPSLAEMPEVVTLQLPNGVVHTACCRWRRGDEAGFIFLPGGSQGSRAATRGRFDPQPVSPQA